ncbi:MAG: hypothetical protein HUU41_18650, partial [Bryobacteraceae bacterium]|nr:hypothetical protein [Bryobacteraceae bacterium]
ETAATGIVELIDDLFAIGQHARERDYGRVERQATSPTATIRAIRR